MGTLRDGIFPPVTQYSPRKIAPVRRTYNWQAEELIISFNMTKSANPSCTRLEPPITWLTVSGARVKKSQQGIDCGDNGESDSRLKESCSSNIEVSVSRNFAESSLSTLRNKGFSREDIYRMLDKGPWVLAFDISNALPRLFTSLQV